MKTKIHTNQIGYGTNLMKRAVCVGMKPSKRISGFRLIDASSGKTMLAGSVSERVYDEASRDAVAEVDFSSFSLPGRYYIKAGRRKSDEFIITEKPYEALKNALLKSFYYNRCSGLDKSRAGVYAHGECHRAPAVFWENKRVTADVSGGWHDSGSYGKYVYTGCVALAHMLYAFRLFPEVFSEKGNIPFSSPDMPDILEECRTELEWMLKMQAEDGGVYHKVCTKGMSEYVMPENEKAPQYIFPRSHQAAAAFTATAALASGIYEKYDRSFASKLRSAALKGWIWLAENPEHKPFVNPPGVKYVTFSDRPDDNFSRAMFWTVCELYSLTGEKIFLSKINELSGKNCASGFEPGFTGGFGILACMLSEREIDEEAQRLIKYQLREEADDLLALSASSGYRTAMSPGDYRQNSNIAITSKAITLITAYKMFGSAEYLKTAGYQIGYMIGINPAGICYITGFGKNSVRYPHHRPSVFDGIDEPVPGLAVAGANSDPSDDYAIWNIPEGAPPARCYCDNGFCYSTNEAYICCSSALLFAAAFFDSESRKPAAIEKLKSVEL